MAEKPMSDSSHSAIKFLPLGTIIQEFIIGGRNITLAFPRQEHYQPQSHPYFGETIGRIPNQVSGGRILNLNGRDYDLIKNERGQTTLHGGANGWGKEYGRDRISLRVTRRKRFKLRC